MKHSPSSLFGSLSTPWLVNVTGQRIVRRFAMLPNTVTGRTDGKRVGARLETVHDLGQIGSERPAGGTGSSICDDRVNGAWQCASQKGRPGALVRS